MSCQLRRFLWLVLEKKKVVASIFIAFVGISLCFGDVVLCMFGNMDFCCPSRFGPIPPSITTNQQKNFKCLLNLVISNSHSFSIYVSLLHMLLFKSHNLLLAHTHHILCLLTLKSNSLSSAVFHEKP